MHGFQGVVVVQDSRPQTSSDLNARLVRKTLERQVFSCLNLTPSAKLSESAGNHMMPEVVAQAQQGG